jgi:hypothetical protein
MRSEKNEKSKYGVTSGEATAEERGMRATRTRKRPVPSRGLVLLAGFTFAAGGLLTAALVGGVAGLYPAARAARLPPSEALRS